MKANEMRKGMVIRFEGSVYKILEATHRTPGNLRAFVQIKMRNVMTGLGTEQRFRSEDDVEKVYLDTKTMQYLYHDAEGYHFMDTDTYDQFALATTRSGHDVVHHRRVGRWTGSSSRSSRSPVHGSGRPDRPRSGATASARRSPPARNRPGRAGSVFITGSWSDRHGERGLSRPGDVWGGLRAAAPPLPWEATAPRMFSLAISRAAFCSSSTDIWPGSSCPVSARPQSGTVACSSLGGLLPATSTRIS
jgi:translation elongation factor P/translation initiation factor 5A